MGFLKPTVRVDQITSASEIEQLQARAKLPKSAGASLLQVVGVIAIILSILGAFSNPLSFVVGLAGAASGGLIWATGTITQYVFDLRTLALREADRRDSVSRESGV